jgi:hypothetical protein
MDLGNLTRLGVACAFMLWLGAAAAGVERRVEIEAPKTVAAGNRIDVVLVASTYAGQGERIGLLQADFSTDGGSSWAGLCYMDNLGPETRQERIIEAGPEGTIVMVRLRVAFRDGLAGDVDYRGAAIRWPGPWANWAKPPAKSVAILVGRQ